MKIFIQITINYQIKIMDKLSVENDSFEYHVLEKHKYPKWIHVLFVFTLLIFISVVPPFLLKDLPYHCAVNQKIADANDCFLNENYDKAIKLYSEILDKHPTFKEGRIRAVESCFALSSYNVSWFEKGIDLLADEKYSKSEISKMNEFLPIKYRKSFKSLFKFEKSIDYFKTESKK